jgi:hypothetical protein
MSKELKTERPKTVIPEPWVPSTTGLPFRSEIDLTGLSARTMNMPGEEYIAATMRSSVPGGERGARELARDVPGPACPPRAAFSVPLVLRLDRGRDSRR